MLGNGSRSRDGCFNCRRRKRRCDEEKPVCQRCRKIGDDCVFPQPPSASNPLKFVVAIAPNHQSVPVNHDHQGMGFLNLSPEDIHAIFSRFQLEGYGEGAQPFTRGLQSLALSRTISPFFKQLPEDRRSVEASLLQYYIEVISSSRVYVQTGRNGFRTSVIPRILQHEGPLLSTVLAMSAAEWGQNMAFDRRDYGALSMHYKVRALGELQNDLSDLHNSETNLLTCVLLASLEIAQGSRPTWLSHLQGALALLDSFGTTIDPTVAQFALQYFRFRYILMETTRQRSSPDESYDQAMASLARAEESIPRPQSTGLIDEQIGCSMELVEVINKISALSLLWREADGAWAKEHLQARGLEIEEKMASLSAQYTNTGDEYLVKSGESFRIATYIYLRLVCYNTALTHQSILELHAELLSCLSDIIVERQARRSFPMWPLFLAGCTCSSDDERKVILNHFALLDNKWPISNISAVWNAVRTVWNTRDLISPAAPCVNQDWREVIHKFGWKLSLS